MERLPKIYSASICSRTGASSLWGLVRAAKFRTSFFAAGAIPSEKSSSTQFVRWCTPENSRSAARSGTSRDPSRSERKLDPDRRALRGHAGDERLPAQRRHAPLQVGQPLPAPCGRRIEAVPIVVDLERCNAAVLPQRQPACCRVRVASDVGE